MKLKEVLAKLESLHNAKMYAHHIKYGAGEKQFGVKLGDIKALAKKIKIDHELAFQLWETEVVDARLLAILIVKPSELSSDQIDMLVRSNTYSQIADWLSAYVIKEHPEKEKLRLMWMQSEDPMAARAGWSLTAGRIARQPEGLDLTALLDRIEAEMGAAPAETQWTMNTALAYLGIHHPEHRERALAIGEKLGVFRDFPTSKGCTSPFAPIWINEMVKRQG